ADTRVETAMQGVSRLSSIIRSVCLQLSTRKPAQDPERRRELDLAEVHVVKPSAVAEPALGLESNEVAAQLVGQKVPGSRAVAESTIHTDPSHLPSARVDRMANSQMRPTRAVHLGGVWPFKASCGRTWLNSWRQRSQARCCSATVAAGVAC